MPIGQRAKKNRASIDTSVTETRDTLNEITSQNINRSIESNSIGSRASRKRLLDTSLIGQPERSANFIGARAEELERLKGVIDPQAVEEIRSLAKNLFAGEGFMREVGLPSLGGAFASTGAGIAQTLAGEEDVDEEATFSRLDQKAGDAFRNLSETLQNISDEKYEEARKNAEKLEQVPFSIDDPKGAERGKAIAQSILVNAPNTIGALALGAGATLAGGPVAGGATLLAYGSALEGGYSRQEALELGATEDEANKIMVRVGLVNGLLETIPQARILNRTFGGRAIKQSLLRSVAKNLAKSGVEEGLTEGIQETVANAFLMSLDEDRELFDNVEEGAVVGFLSGLGFGAGSSVVQAYRQARQQAIEEGGPDAGFARIRREENIPEDLQPLAEEVEDGSPELSDIVQDDTLFNEFPELRGLQVRILESGTRQASFIQGEDLNSSFIQLSKRDFFTERDGKLVIKNKENLLETLIEEITHAKQTLRPHPDSVEGQPTLRSPEEIRRLAESVEVEGGDIIEEGVRRSENLSEIEAEIEKRNFFNQVKQQETAEVEDTLTQEEEIRAEAIEQARQEESNKIQRRRTIVREIGDRFGLTPTDIRKVNRSDVRNMTDNEFQDFVNNLETKAVEIQDTKQAKIELISLINNREFEKVENYRRAKEYPPITQMNAEQLRDYMESLAEFEVGDEFLPERTIEVIDRTEKLQGVRTMREVREILSEEITENTGKEVKIEDLQNLSVGALEKWTYDTALAEKNPVFGYIVQRTQAHLLEGERNFFEVQEKVNELAKKAKKSRNRTFFEGVKQFIIPQYEEIVQYLEANPENKEWYADKLTKEELDYANFIERYYSQAYDHLVQIKELYGSRFIDQYFTHIRKNFLEEWKDNGILSAFRNVLKQNKEDQVIANIIDQDTGIILPKSKFFQFTVQRKGGIDPSKNVTRVFLNYVRMFERKKMLDKMVPEIEVYAQSLTPKETTENGLEVDRSLKTFINKYLNNKRGRRENFGGHIRQNGPADMMIRMGNMFVSLLDLGLAIGPSVASTIGEQVMTYQALGKIKFVKAWKRRLWDVGIKRKKTSKGKSILKKYENFVGRNIWTELAEPDKGFGERATQAIFGVFSQSSAEANKIFLLGSLTKEELQSGELSSERLAELRLEAGRWRDMGNQVKSIAGSTSFGRMLTKYKGWAIPIIRTTLKDIKDLSIKVKNKEFKEALTGREIQELYRAIEMSVVLVSLGSMILSEDDDDSFLGKLKARAYMESMTLLGGIDPTLFISMPRLGTFLGNLANNLKKIATMEQYETDTRWGDKGDLKGLKGLQRQFTPSVFGQFDFSETTGSSEVGGRTQTSRSNVGSRARQSRSRSGVGSRTR